MILRFVRREPTTLHKAKCAHPAEETRRLWASGANGKRYPVKLCRACGRLSFDDDSDIGFAKAWRLSPPARLDTLLRKALAASCFSDPASCDLRWITLHPNGDDTTGVPVLVHDNGSEYTIVGGAGHKLDHRVLKKPAGIDEGKKNKRRAPKPRIDGEEAQALSEKATAITDEAKAREKALTEAVLEHMHTQGAGSQDAGGFIDKLKAQARATAISQKKDATPDEQEEFASESEKHAEAEAKKAAREAVRQVLTAAARNQMGDGAADGSAEVTVGNARKVLGQAVVDHIVHESANIASLKAQVKSIQRALRSGNEDVMRALEVEIRPLTPEAAKAQNLTQYMNGERVNDNVALLREVEKSGEKSRARFETAGAADGLNGYVATHTGQAVLTPELVRQVGINNACRVAAAHMEAEGADPAKSADALKTRMAETGGISVAACLKKCAEIDQLVANAKAAGAADDGTLTKNQSAIIAANMALTKYRIVNVTKGQLTAASTLAHHIEFPSRDAMAITAGTSKIAAHAKAASLGLSRGEYEVHHQDGGGYNLIVPREHIGKIARPMTMAEADRNAAMDDLRSDVELHAGDWKSEGFNNDFAMLAPHQELAARAIIQQKRMILNLGAGCIDGATLIEDPVRGLTLPVEEWMERGLAPHVWALNKEGQRVIASASIPFIKAYEVMYDVRMSSGSTIRVAGGHRFLTPEGWLPIKALAPGAAVALACGDRAPSAPQQIAKKRGERQMLFGKTPPTASARAAKQTPLPESLVKPGDPVLVRAISLYPAECALSLLASSWGSTPQAFLEGDLHSLHTGTGYRSRYHPLPLYDGPPRSGAACGQGAVPSHSDALGYSRGCSSQGGQAYGAGRTRPNPLSGHPSMPRFASLAGRQASGQPVCLPGVDTVGSTPGQYRSRPLFADRSSLPHCAHESEHRAQAALKISTLYPHRRNSLIYNTVEWGQVASIDPVQDALVYDLEVYEHHNYLAAGIWNHNSGKTPTLYAAAGHALATGLVDRVLCTMPKKPRAQQEDYSDEDDLDEHDQPRQKQGEKKKFLRPDLAAATVVIESTEHLKKVLADVDAGKTKMIIMGPELMRANVDLLKSHGFGGKRSMYLADEAHELLTREGKDSSQRAGAAAQMAQSEYFAPMSGTLVQSNGSEMWSALNMVQPGAHGSQAAFAQEWNRLSQGGQNFFANENMAGMRDRLSGTMISYQKEPNDPETGKPLVLDSHVVTVPVHPLQREAIARVQKEYARVMAGRVPESEWPRDPKTGKGKDPRKAAALQLNNKVMTILTRGVKDPKTGKVVNPKLDVLQQIYEAEKKRSGANRIGVYSKELAPLRAAADRLGVNLESIIGDNSDKETARACKRVNDRENDTDGVALSKAGNYGLNLTGLDHMVKLHCPDTAAEEVQLDHRHLRKGQTRQVRSTLIVTDHPFEQKALYNLRNKKLPEVDLLGRLADDSGRASQLAAYSDTLKEAAGGNAQAA